MTRTFRRLLALAFLLPILAASPARAQLYNAGDPCPEPTAGRIFTQEGAAGPSLVCNGTTLEVDESVTTGPYARGVGTATPQATLDVNGGVRIGADTTCTAAKEGTIRYVAASDVYEFCNGTSWVPVGNTVGGATGQSMVAGWPDAIVCNVTNLNFGPTVFYPVHMPYADDGLYYYRLIYGGASWTVRFNADGTFNSYESITTSDCNVSIATLISSGKAFNLANGAVGTAAQMSDGTAGAPGLYFLSDTNTGLYRPGNDTLAFATAGVESLRMTATGSVGIGTITPKAPLQVVGEVIVGTTTGLACDADRKGGLRWSDAQSTIEMCDGTDWKQIAAATCDNAPAFFPFTAQAGLGVSTLVTSNIATITGMDAGCTATVSVSGASGSPEYRVCSTSDCSSVTQDWTAANNTIDMQGKYLQLRATTSASAGTEFTITGTVGPVSSDWSITTLPADCSLSPVGTVCADGTVYAGTSPASGTPMYITRCDGGRVWGGSSCSGSRLSTAWNNGNGSGYVDTSLTNCGAAPCAGTADGSANTTTLAAADSDSGAGGVQPHAAAVYCDGLNIHGQTDWYLPSLPELDVIVRANNPDLTNGTGDDNTLGDFAMTSYYWSSSESNVSYAWLERPSDGNQFSNLKDSGSAVRCARR